MDYKPVLLWSDMLLYLLVIVLVGFICWARRQANWRAQWGQVLYSKIGCVSLVILLAYFSIALLDSIHYSPALPNLLPDQPKLYSSRVYSALDSLLYPLGRQYEQTYSAPFASHLFVQRTEVDSEGKVEQYYPRLKFSAANVKGISKETDIGYRIFIGFVLALGLWLTLRWLFARPAATKVQWKSIWSALFWVLAMMFVSYFLSRNYHIFGTDKVGQDVFYQTVKSIRTGLLIGTLTTLIMLPFAVLLGTAAGYFGGVIDDIIQYIYTTLNSIPGVLLIAAAILSMQIFITNHPECFSQCSATSRCAITLFMSYFRGDKLDGLVSNIARRGFKVT